ncbi:MAG: ABC transporter permease [Oscillospiraceae bacterium]|jgi:putative ABC transport system permease protein|nr:ABC transporter permease [Oscillospiraceae bacterium]
MKKLTASLAYSQLNQNRRRSLWTLAGIILSTAMITAVCGFVASGDAAMIELQGEDYYETGVYKSTLIGLGAVLSLIIVSASVVVVSNAFRVSAGERKRQFGLLKSVGATKRQIAQTVMYEGVMLSLAGIPIGIAAGMLVDLAGITIANYFLEGLNRINADMGNAGLYLRFLVPWQMPVIAAAVAFLTVMVSAWLPARKAAKIAAIDAIRGAGDVKIKPRQARPNRLISLLFGFEGALASKSMKRARRSFRATVTSLTVGIVLMIVAGNLGVQMRRMVVIAGYGMDATVTALWSYRGQESGKLNGADAQAAADELGQFQDTQIYGVGANLGAGETRVPREMLTAKMTEFLEDFRDFPYAPNGEFAAAVSLISADEDNYARLCARAGVPVGSNILINVKRTEIDEKKSEFAPYVFAGQTLTMDVYGKPSVEIPLHGQLSGGDVPTEIIYAADNQDLVILVPSLQAEDYVWFAAPQDVKGFISHAKAVLERRIAGTGAYAQVTDIREVTRAIRNFTRVVMVFVYGFVGMLILIGLTNVISTISTNIRARAGEFAVLQSVGMTRKGIARMLNLESVLCSLRALLLGIPLGLLASFLLHRSIAQSTEFAYEPPLMSVIYCVAGVLAVTWVTMRYSASKLRGESIVEAIRGESMG